MIKPFDNGGLESIVDSVIQKSLMSDTTLRSFIPPQFLKMNPKLRQIYRFEIWIIPKDMQIDLNIFITRLVTDLQHKYVGSHKNNSAYSTTSDAH